MVSRSSATIRTNRSISSACSRTNSESFCICASKCSNRQARSFAPFDDGLLTFANDVTTTSRFIACSLDRGRPTHHPRLRGSINSRQGDVNVLAFFLFHGGPDTIRRDEQHFHDDPLGWQRGTPPAPDGTSGETRRPVWWEIPDHRLYPQQLFEFRAPEDRRADPIQVALP